MRGRKRARQPPNNDSRRHGDPHANSQRRHREGSCPSSLGSGESRVLGKDRRTHREAQPLDLDHLADDLLLHLGAVERGDGQPRQGGLSVHQQPAVLADCSAGTFRGHAAGVLQLHGAHLRRAPLDGDLHAESAAAGRGHGHRAAGQQHQLQHAADPGRAVRSGGRQLQLQHGQHQLLLPEGEEGHGHGPQRGHWQPGGEPGAVRGAAGDLQRHGGQLHG